MYYNFLCKIQTYQVTPCYTKWSKNNFVINQLFKIEHNEWLQLSQIHGTLRSVQTTDVPGSPGWENNDLRCRQSFKCKFSLFYNSSNTSLLRNFSKQGLSQTQGQGQELGLHTRLRYFNFTVKAKAKHFHTVSLRTG